MPARPLTNRAIRAVIHEVCPDDDVERNPDEFNAAFIDTLFRYMTADMNQIELARFQRAMQSDAFNDAMVDLADDLADTGRETVSRVLRET